MSAVLEKKSPAINRAYSILEIKAVHEDERIIEGIATTISPDRMGDVVETDGIEFKLPMPLLNQHNSREPVGNVIKAEVRKGEIWIRAKFAAPGLLDYVDRAWAQVKAGLVRGLSIGFRSLEESWDKELGGFHFLRSEWMELSVVTIPANADASILSVKTAALGEAVSGRKFDHVVRLSLNPNPSGVPGQPKKEHRMKVRISEQISQFEAKSVAAQTRMTEIMDKAAEEGRSLDETEKTEYDGLKAEVKEVSEHIGRLKDHEQIAIQRATSVTSDVGTDPAKASVNRGGLQSSGVQVRSMAPKGILPARMAIAMYKANNNALYAAELAKMHWPDMPEVGLTLKAIVEAGDTTTSGWASQLVPSAQQLAGEFLDMYRNKTIMNRIQGTRMVPFNVAVPIRTAAGTFSWVGEAVAKPVTSETFTNITLTWAKAAAIIVITQELAKFSSPNAELLIRDSMIETLVRFFDSHFVSDTAAVANVSPAGILNGKTPVTPSGTSAATFRTDMNNLMNNFTANSVPLSGITLLMSDTQAVALSLMVTDLGVPLFPSVSSSGGTLLGFPVVTSEAVGTKIIAVKASDILIAEDPGVSVTASDQATIEMETTPAAGEQSPPSTQSVLKSMFQNNCIAIRAEQFKTWARARTAAVEYINGNAYVP